MQTECRGSFFTLFNPRAVLLELLKRHFSGSELFNVVDRLTIYRNELYDIAKTEWVFVYNFYEAHELYRGYVDMISRDTAETTTVITPDFIENLAAKIKLIGTDDGK